jgi:hypothetical protein
VRAYRNSRCAVLGLIFLGLVFCEAAWSDTALRDQGKLVQRPVKPASPVHMPARSVAVRALRANRPAAAAATPIRHRAAASSLGGAATYDARKGAVVGGSVAHHRG